MYKGTAPRPAAEYSAETLPAKREWENIFKVQQKENFQSRILYLAKLSIQIEGEFS